MRVRGDWVTAAVAALLTIPAGLLAQEDIPCVAVPHDYLLNTIDIAQGLDVEEVRVQALDFAVAQARTNLDCKPADADAHYLLAVAIGIRLEHHGIRAKVQAAEEVRGLTEAALELDSSHGGAHFVLGRLHAATMRLGRVQRFVAQRLLGADLVGVASWESAEALFLDACRLEPDNATFHIELASLYIDTDREDRARAVLETTSTLAPLTNSDITAVARAVNLLDTMD